MTLVCVKLSYVKTLCLFVICADLLSLNCSVLIYSGKILI